MKRISYWAKNNVVKARILIVIAEVMLFVFAVSLGILLMRIDVYLPLLIAIISFLLLIMAIIFYPSKEMRRKLRAKLYTRQKTCDISIAVSVFMLVCFTINREKIIEWNVYTPLHGTYISFKELKEGAPAKKTVSKKQARKELRALRKNLRKDKDAFTALYVALVIIGSIGLFVLLAVLACSISCSGNDGLALLVLLVGTFGIVFLATKLITHIIRRRKKPVEKNNTTAILRDK